MIEYGIFHDEGCVYAPCYSLAEAEAQRVRLLESGLEFEGNLEIWDMCPNHEAQPADNCAECFECEHDGMKGALECSDCGAELS